MPSFSTEVPHQLSQEEAVARLTDFVAGVREHYADQVSEMDGNWTDNVLNFRLTTFGLTIKGELRVEPDRARLKGELPFAALPFKGRIEKSISTELARALAEKA